MHQEYSELNSTQIDTLNTENLMDDRGHVLLSPRTAFKSSDLGVAVDPADASRSTVAMRLELI